MIAKVHKIRPDMDSNAQTILGMVNASSEQIKHIAAIVVWENGDYQLVHDAMKKSELAYAFAIFQKEIFEEL